MFLIGFYCLLIIFSPNLTISQVQTHFTLSGKTDLIENGKAILIREVPDTVVVTNNKFRFEGMISYPEPCRIVLLNNEGSNITEFFFIDTGFQEISIISSLTTHDYLDVGVGVNLKGSITNNEYFNSYLNLFGKIYEQMDTFYLERSNCNTIQDDEKRKECIVKNELEKMNLRESRDSILFNYAILHPQSKLLPWLIRNALYYYGYNEYYQKAFDQIKNTIPKEIEEYLDSTLKRNKLKSAGQIFPLKEFINSHLTDNLFANNDYVLVDFWFAACRPCIKQFGDLKNIYQKYKDLGFDIVAISIDKPDEIAKYQQLLEQNNYSWHQILDTSGITTESINITKFPSNFLLDSTGKILDIDVNPFVLEDYLKKNISQKHEERNE